MARQTRALSKSQIAADVRQFLANPHQGQLPTVDEIARAIAYHWRSRRYDGVLNAREYAEGIVEGRDAHIRWQDRMFAEERMKGTAHDRNIDKAMLGEIASEVAAYRSRARR